MAAAAVPKAFAWEDLPSADLPLPPGSCSEWVMSKMVGAIFLISSIPKKSTIRLSLKLHHKEHFQGSDEPQ